MPLRVLHLGKYYPPAVGGIETHVRTLAQAQARLGAQVTVVCVEHRDCEKSKGRAGRSTEETDGPVKVVRVRRRAQLAKWDYCPGLTGVLRRRFHDADIVHLQVPNATMLVAATPLANRVPLVVGYQSDVVRQRILVHALRPFERRVFRAARRLMPSSPRYAGGSPVLQAHSEKVEPLPLGINLEPYLQPSPAAHEFAKRLRLDHGGPLWLSVGRLVYYKGHAVAVEALATTPGKLLVVGVGPDEPLLRRRAEQFGVADRIVWLGNIADEAVVGAYHAATALWFPSNARSEAFGLAQVEAMACGCPVINTDIPHSGSSWVSLHLESGLTVAVDSPVELSAAARRLIDEPELRARLSIGARERAICQFSAEAMARRSLEIYREVLGETAVEGGRKPCVADDSALLAAGTGSDR